MVKNSQPLPILYFMINSGNDSIFTDFVFSSFCMMLENPESSIKEYMNNLSFYFDYKDIQLLCSRIQNKRNKEIPMNQKHIIMLIAILKANLIIYCKEKEILNRTLKIKEIDEVKDELEKFVGQVESYIEAFKKRFKSNHSITSAFAKVIEQ